MSQITIGGTTLNFKDSAFTGDQWEQVASWVLNGGAEGIDADAQIATEKAAAASASAAAARNSATSAGESATASANSATAAKASEDAAQSWAVGGTGTRDGEDTNNAKYWAEQAQQAAGRVVSFNGRSGSVVPQAGDYDKVMIGLGNVDNTSDLEKPISTATQAALNAKSNNSETVTAVLLEASWTEDAAPYTYTLHISGVTDTSNQEVLPALNITVEQLEALQSANIQDGGQAANTMTLKAYGDKPTIDLPIRVIKRGD